MDHLRELFRVRFASDPIPAFFLITRAGVTLGIRWLEGKRPFRAPAGAAVDLRRTLAWTGPPGAGGIRAATPR